MRLTAAAARFHLQAPQYIRKTAWLKWQRLLPIVTLISVSQFTFVLYLQQLNLNSRSSLAVDDGVAPAIKVDVPIETGVELRPRRRVFDIHCQQAIDPHGSRQVIPRASPLRSGPRSDLDLATAANNCGLLRRNYVLHALSESEREFPLAYVLLVHQDAVQVERLLRALYRPHNSYCIHVDDKASWSFKLAVDALCSCFQNVFVASRPQRVQWGRSSQVLANLACMSDLLAASHDWRYLLNIAGQEFPLRTNGELVHILRLYYPYNDISSSVYGDALRKVVFARTRYNMSHLAGPQRIKPPPHKLHMRKGLAYGAFTREFVHYLLHSQVSRDFWSWLRRGEFTDELYWNTLNGNPQVYPQPPGSWYRNRSGPSDLRAVKWLDHGRESCRGKFTRNVCIFGVGDLPWLTWSRELIANKFHGLDVNRTLSGAYDCIEEWFWNRTAEQALDDNSGPSEMDLSFYKSVRRRWLT